MTLLLHGAWVIAIIKFEKMVVEMGGRKEEMKKKLPQLPLSNQYIVAGVRRDGNIVVRLITRAILFPALTVLSLTYAGYAPEIYTIPSNKSYHRRDTGFHPPPRLAQSRTK